MSEKEKPLRELSHEELMSRWEALESAVQAEWDMRRREACGTFKLWRACGARVCRRKQRCSHPDLLCNALLPRAPTPQLRELAYTLQQMRATRADLGAATSACAVSRR